MGWWTVYDFCFLCECKVALHKKSFMYSRVSWFMAYLVLPNKAGCCHHNTKTVYDLLNFLSICYKREADQFGLHSSRTCLFVIIILCSYCMLLLFLWHTAIDVCRGPVPVQWQTSSRVDYSVSHCIPHKYNSKAWTDVKKGSISAVDKVSATFICLSIQCRWVTYCASHSKN